MPRQTLSPAGISRDRRARALAFGAALAMFAASGGEVAAAMQTGDPAGAETVCASKTATERAEIARLCAARAAASPKDRASWDAAILSKSRSLGLMPRPAVDKATAAPAQNRAEPAVDEQDNSVARSRAEKAASQRPVAGASETERPNPAGPSRAVMETVQAPPRHAPRPLPALEDYIEKACDFTREIWCRLEPRVAFEEVMWDTPVPGDPRHVPATSIFWSYSTFAFDGRTVYAHGGGHAAYDGNEVYAFDLATLEWRRLSAPEPLGDSDWLIKAFPEVDLADCPWPKTGIAAGHVNDSAVILDGKLHIWARAFSCGKYGTVPRPVAAYGVFDVGTGRWSHREPIRKSRKGWPGAQAMVEYDAANDRMIAITSGRDPRVFMIDPKTNAAIGEGPKPPYGYQLLGVMEVVDGTTFLTNSGGIYRITDTGITHLSDYPGAASHDDALRHDGERFVIWDGEKSLYTTPDFRSWNTYVPDRGPGKRRHIFNRFYYLAAQDLFVALPRHDEIWLARVPREESGEKARIEAEGYTCADTIPGWECPDLQRLVDAGGDVDLPKGIFLQCATLRRPVTINGNGAHLKGKACSDKAALVVKADARIRDLECSEITVSSGNGACIRQETDHVTLERVHFHDSQEGVLTNQSVLSLTILDSRFSRLGGDCRIKCGRAHGVYFASIAGALTIRNSSFRLPLHQGHLIKSGAARTVIENSTLDERVGEGSRLIDAYNGGVLVIRNTTLENAPGGNSNVIGYDFEGRADHPVNRIVLEAVTARCRGGLLLDGRNSYFEAEMERADVTLDNCR